MKTKIYTKGGDTGQTSLFGGPRVSKANPLLDGYGTVDELNAHMGLAIGHLPPNENHLSATLLEIQNDLFVVGSHLACGDDSFRDKLPPLREARILDLEKKIDQMTDTLPELKEFILPGGALCASHLHVCRTVCRRAERAVIAAFAKANAGENGVVGGHTEKGASGSTDRGSSGSTDAKGANDFADGKELNHASEVIVKYLNRLSDFLFVAARFVNFNAKAHETKWKKP